MITRDDVIDLLKLCAVYDQRTVGEEDVKGWLLVAHHFRWSLPAATRVVVEHYAQGAGRPRITPAEITDGLRDVRRRAATSFEAPVIPAQITNAEYPRWYREQLSGHVDRVLARWVAGDPIPVGTPTAIACGPPRRVRDAVRVVADTTRIP